jgi:hypothetical protein
MASYQVLTGKKYDVVADTPEQAEQKYHAYIAGEDCPCGFPQWGEEAEAEFGGDELCSCVEFNEIDTLVVGGDE